MWGKDGVDFNLFSHPCLERSSGIRALVGNLHSKVWLQVFSPFCSLTEVLSDSLPQQQFPECALCAGHCTWYMMAWQWVGTCDPASRSLHFSELFIWQHDICSCLDVCFCISTFTKPQGQEVCNWNKLFFNKAFLKLKFVIKQNPHSIREIWLVPFLIYCWMSRGMSPHDHSFFFFPPSELAQRVRTY